MFEYSSLKKEEGKPEWFTENEAGVELVVPGGAQGPDPAAVDQARNIAGKWDEILAKAINLAEGFMKDTGEWHVNGVDVLDSRHDDYDYAITLWFDPADGSQEYASTQFSVFFRAHAEQPGPTQNHPSKLVIEFI